jgi:hypothetical protein
MGLRDVLKLLSAHGPLTRWTLTGQGIEEKLLLFLVKEVIGRPLKP